MRKLIAGVLLSALAFAARGAQATDDASAGYQTIRPSLVKVWAFDRSGRPTDSGTGIVVDSNAQRSLVLTASHVIAGAAGIRIDVSRNVHDVAAHVERTGPRDLTLLSVDRGGLQAAHFAARTRPVVEGNLVAIAGYVKQDELIGVVGQEPRVLFPGTVSSRPENGIYLELENVHIEEGLSGGAVFDPQSGDVLGVVTARTSDSRGGFADSGALVVVPFLARGVVAQQAPPAPRPSAPPLVPPSLAPPVLRPQPAPTLQAVIGFSVAPARSDGITSWQAANSEPKRFDYVRLGCRVAITLDVDSLQFVVPHDRGAQLTITLEQRAANSDACADTPDADPTQAAYQPTAMSYDGHHVTMRFVYAGDPDAGGRFPSDASLDADLSGDNVTATVQFFDRDWSGSIALPLSRTAPASVSRIP